MRLLTTKSGMTTKTKDLDNPAKDQPVVRRLAGHGSNPGSMGVASPPQARHLQFSAESCRTPPAARLALHVHLLHLWRGSCSRDVDPCAAQDAPFVVLSWIFCMSDCIAAIRSISRVILKPGGPSAGVGDAGAGAVPSTGPAVRRSSKDTEDPTIP